MNEKTKRCGLCREMKSLTLFHHNKNQSDGYQTRCIECSKKYVNENINKIRNTRKNYRKSHYDIIRKNIKRYERTLKGKLMQWKTGAKKRNISFEITLSDLEKIPMICYYTGVPLTLERNEWYSISLDRLDSSKGYTKENIVFCCGFINRMKNNLTYGQFIRACAKIAMHCGAREQSISV